ncbi:MAG TPA: alpha/beta fold hydrolase [Solirubrobacterales bacterium]|nr:alpha/beta fold hydrolase [Solirubrobacterales bacterium]
MSTPTTHADPRVEAAIAHWAPRMTTQGIDLNDFTRTSDRVDRWEQWLDAWSDQAEVHLALAEEAESLGRRRTAGEAYVRAALCFHFAKYVWVLDGERNRETTIRARDALYEAHRLLDPDAERIEAAIATGGVAIANLRRPPGDERPPLVILIPGLDSTKEEFFNFERVFLDRGLATLSLDGPGQGEAGFEAPIRHDYEVAVTAMLDALEHRDDLDMGRVGAAGVSLGGYYAPRAAAFEPRLRAAAAVSGPRCFGALWDELPELTRESFTYYARSPDAEAARAAAMRLDLTGVAARIEQPLLVVAGKLDRLIPWESTKAVADESPNAEFILYEEGNHVCNNVAYRYRPLLADWLSEQLRGGRHER